MAPAVRGDLVDGADGLRGDGRQQNCEAFSSSSDILAFWRRPGTTFQRMPSVEEIPAWVLRRDLAVESV